LNRAGAPPPALLLAACAPRNGSRLPPEAVGAIFARGPLTTAAARKAALLFRRAGAPSPALLLGAFAPRNGSRLPLVEAPGATFSPRSLATVAARFMRTPASGAAAPQGRLGHSRRRDRPWPSAFRWSRCRYAGRAGRFPSAADRDGWRARSHKHRAPRPRSGAPEAPTPGPLR